MNPRFLVDAQLPPALADHLSSIGLNRVDLGAASDSVIWAYAKQSEMVLISKDEDFVSTASRSHLGPPVIWVRLGNTTNRVLWRAFKETCRYRRHSKLESVLLR
jgi:predicted nuclease of predicted toxin-antitoxin system